MLPQLDLIDYINVVTVLGVEGKYMSKITSKLSKQVGWVPRNIKYPESMIEVENASDFSLLVWTRFLDLPTSPDQEEMNRRIFERVHETENSGLPQ